MPGKKKVTKKKSKKSNFLSFQDIIMNLQKFWGRNECVILQPYDMEVGAGTFHPATTLRSLGSKPWKAAYVQPSRRPTDGRYGDNPNRLQHYYQFQVLLNQKGYGKIQTKIKPLVEFHYAEEYHQDYLVKNPNGYCPDHSTGIVFQDQESLKKVDNDFLFEGKHILVIESDSCPYCIKFRENVLSKYKGTIPLSFRTSSQLNGLSIKTETWATPTFLLLEDGKEIYGKRGYMDGDEFYKFLGIFKLGKTEAFNVAFNEGTDARYCKEYEIFKNTPDGIFVDKLSGAPLFDTRDRFNSGTGWLSFTKPVDGSVYRRADNSYGMRRIEIRSKTSDIHLGHVFPDGPNGLPRYCINATVLEFKNRKEIDKS